MSHPTNWKGKVARFDLFLLYWWVLRSLLVAYSLTSRLLYDDTFGAGLRLVMILSWLLHCNSCKSPKRGSFTPKFPRSFTPSGVPILKSEPGSKLVQAWRRLTINLRRILCFYSTAAAWTLHVLHLPEGRLVYQRLLLIFSRTRHVGTDRRFCAHDFLTWLSPRFCVTLPGGF